MKFIGLIFSALTLSTLLIAGGLEKKLFKAVLNGNTAQVEKLIKQGADVNYTVGGRESLLICAAERGFHDIANLLVTNGAEVDHRTKKGDTALHRAAKYGRYQVASDLIQKGVDVQATMQKANTPLHLAVERRDFSMIRLLLDHGADADQQDYAGRSALHLAAEFSKPNIMETLLLVGAAVNLQDDSGKTPLHYAVFENNPQTTKRLLQYGADATIEDKNGESALDLVQPWSKDIRALLNPSDDIIWEDVVNLPRLDLETLKGFLAEGMDVNEAAKNGATLIFFAVENGNLEALQYLIDQGADIEKVDFEGVSPLMVATINGRTATVKKLLEHGADPNLLSKNGFGALYLAGLRQDEHLAKTLMDGGAFRVAKLFKDFIDLPPKKARYRRLMQQMRWLPNLTRASYIVSKHVKTPEDTAYPDAFSLRDSSAENFTMPKFTQKVRPNYPIAALKSKVNGYVIVEAVLTKDGFTDEFRVLKAMANGRYGFEIAAIESIKQWKFEPGTLNGEPVDVRMTLKLDFVVR